MFTPLYVFSDFALLFLRVVLAIIFVAHGWSKIKNLKGTGGWLSSVGLKPGIFWALVVSCFEFFGGLLVIAGAFTQIIALGWVIIMLVAILVVKRKLGLVGGYEFELLLIATALALVTLGGGTYSLDDFFFIFLY